MGPKKSLQCSQLFCFRLLPVVLEWLALGLLADCPVPMPFREVAPTGQSLCIAWYSE